MKTKFNFFMAILFAIPILFNGCQKSELANDDSVINNTSITKSAKSNGATPVVATLLDWENTIFPGTVSVINDDANLYVTFETNPDFEMWKTALYVGPYEDIPGDYVDPETHTGQFDPGAFPYSDVHDPRVQNFTYSIPLTSMSLENCFAVVTIAIVKNKITGELTVVTGMLPTKSTGYYFDYCLQDYNEPGSETAFAYGADLATCFSTIPGVNSNRWGWSNGPITDPSSYSWEIYAGAGQCKIEKGTLVGTLDVDYAGGIVNVTYNIFPDFTLDETHLFVGDEYLPRKNNNKFTTAPGQFPYSGETSYSIVADGPIYVVAHSVVSGYFDK